MARTAPIIFTLDLELVTDGDAPLRMKNASSRCYNSGISFDFFYPNKKRLSQLSDDILKIKRNKNSKNKQEKVKN